MEYNKNNFKIIATDGEIDLIAPVDFNDEEDFFYDIALHGTNTLIGDIDYEDKWRDTSIMGNVGYSIRKEYRGNHYAKKALTLLKKVLQEHGKEKIILSIERDNLASIKTAENFGASLICYRPVPKNHVLYNSISNKEVMIYMFNLNRGRAR